MYYGNSFHDWTGSSYEDRLDLQSMLYSSRIPDSVKAELVADYNERYIGLMTTDTYTNLLRHDIW